MGRRLASWSPLAAPTPGSGPIGELQLVIPALAALSRERWILWLSPPYIPYAPALAASGSRESPLLRTFRPAAFFLCSRALARAGEPLEQGGRVAQLVEQLAFNQ